jgi:hypothetical protein
MGTLRLEGTNEAVDAVAASELLPLWQLLAQLQGSGSAAPEEITAVVEEIRLLMTSEQIQAIDSMQFTQTNIAAPPSKASASADSASQSAPADAGPLMGDMPAGGAPDAGVMPVSSSQTTTSASSATATGSSPAVIRQVIELLKSKSQG